MALYISDDGESWTKAVEANHVNDQTSGKVPPLLSSTPAQFYKIHQVDDVDMNFSNYGWDDSFAEKQVKIISKDEDAKTITVDGGEWLTESETAGQNFDKTWSAKLSAPGGIINPESAFNVANPPQPDGGWAAVTVSNGATITFDASGFDLNGSVRVMAATSVKLTVKFEGVPEAEFFSGLDTTANATWTEVGSGKLEYITSTNPNAGQF